MKTLSKEAQRRIFFYISVILLVGVLVPLFIISGYNFMCLDDYPYIQDSNAMWQETHSVFQLLRNQFEYAYSVYVSWQGTFSMEWLGSALMVLFCEKHYYVGTILCLGGFVLSEGLLLMNIFRKGLGADFYSAGTVSCWCIMIQVLLMPYPVEAFYWACGAILYMLAHALALFLCLFFFLFLRCGNKTAGEKRKIAALQCGIFLLSAILGTGNYVTAITVLVGYILLNAGVWIKKHPYRFFVLADTVIYLAAFLLNVLAPGNRKRMNAAGAEEISAVKAILKSVYEAAVYFCGNTTLPVILVGVLLVPVMLKIVNVKKFRYPFPLLVSILSFGVYASQFVPTIYSVGILGAGRVQNLYRANLYVLLYVNELYWIGWYARICREDQKACAGENEKRSGYLPAFWMIGIVLLCFSFIPWGGKTVTTVSAVETLRTGQAKTYYEEYQERLEVLKDDSITEAYVRPFSNPPYLLFFGDLQKDSSAWENVSMAQFYGKKEVHLIQD